MIGNGLNTSVICPHDIWKGVSDSLQVVAGSQWGMGTCQRGLIAAIFANCWAKDDWILLVNVRDWYPVPFKLRAKELCSIGLPRAWDSFPKDQFGIQQGSPHDGCSVLPKTASYELVGSIT